MEPSSKQFSGEKFRYEPVSRQRRIAEVAIALAPVVAALIYVVRTPSPDADLFAILISSIFCLPIALYLGLRKKRKAGDTEEYTHYLQQQQLIQQSRNREIASAASSVVLFIGFSACIATIGWQAYYWLRYGVWKELPLSLWVETPTTDWIGLNRILEIVWDANVGVIALAIGLLAVFAFRE